MDDEGCVMMRHIPLKCLTGYKIVLCLALDHRQEIALLEIFYAFLIIFNSLGIRVRNKLSLFKN